MSFLVNILFVFEDFDAGLGVDEGQFVSLKAEMSEDDYQFCLAQDEGLPDLFDLGLDYPTTSKDTKDVFML